MADLLLTIFAIAGGAAVQVASFILIKRWRLRQMDEKMRRNNLYGENN
jgi:hypothetical protein